MPEEKDQYEIELQEPEKAEKPAEPEIEIVEEEEKEEIQPKLAKEEVIDPEEGIHDLKNKLLAEQRMRIEAERRAQEAVQRQYKAQSETEDANFMLVESAIKTVMSQAEEIKAQYKEALAVGDYDRVTELQEALAENKVNLSELRKGHDYMKRQREQGQKAPPQEYSAQDPVEALASRLSPRSADWVRRNPQFATDQRLFKKMVSAHEIAVADGLEPDSDEYFETVEGILKVRQPEKPAKRVEPEPEEDAMSEAAKPTQRRAAPPAAPVSRSSGGPGTTRSNAIKLTRAEVEAARDMGMTELAYWENKQLLKKEGRI